MITHAVRQFLEAQSCAYVATADAYGHIHIAYVEKVALSGDSLLVIEDCFCPVTLRNIAGSTHISVVVANSETGTGYQVLGTVNRYANHEIELCSDTMERKPEKHHHHVLTRFTVTVDTILEFTRGIHSDLPIVDVSRKGESR